MGQKDLSLVQWMMAHIADALLNEDFRGAQELCALGLVSIDQANYPGSPGSYPERGGLPASSIKCWPQQKKRQHQEKNPEGRQREKTRGARWA